MCSAGVSRLRAHSACPAVPSYSSFSRPADRSLRHEALPIGSKPHTYLIAPMFTHIESKECDHALARQAAAEAPEETGRGGGAVSGN